MILKLIILVSMAIDIGKYLYQVNNTNEEITKLDLEIKLIVSLLLSIGIYIIFLL